MRFLTSMLVILLASSTVLADDNIVVVVDTSGSMETYMREAKATRIEVAKEALTEVLLQLPESTNVGVITFNGWIYPIGKVDKEKLKQAIANMPTGGGTPLYEFMKGGATELLRTRKSFHNNGSYKLLVVTDGEAGDDHLNRDEKDREGNIEKPGVLTDILARGLTVDAIGLDMKGDHGLATKINGRYMRGDDKASLKAALQRATAEASISDPNDAQAAEEFFAIFKGMSDEFAAGVLKTIGDSQNHPIGELPPAVPEFSAAVDAPPVFVPAAVPNTDTASSHGTIFLICVGVGVLAVFVVVILGLVVSRGQ